MARRHGHGCASTSDGRPKLRNAKADPVAGTFPDENYAREVMQLFSIGLVQLQPDGTLKLDAQGLPIPTYTNTTITEVAKVFTGWGYFNLTAGATNNLNQFRGARADYINPMMLYAVAHENAAKDIRPVLGAAIPANLGGTEDLKRMLDALFNHANCAPFISRQLIQRLVTDNPSPAYVYRVAQKFENNGSGVRGDLAAVVRAILTDYEARSTAVYDDPGYGKLKEPLLRFTALVRGFNADYHGRERELRVLIARFSRKLVPSRSFGQELNHEPHDCLYRSSPFRNRTCHDHGHRAPLRRPARPSKELNPFPSLFHHRVF